jgi:hypothetical protein
MALNFTIKQRATDIPAPLPSCGVGIRESGLGDHPVGEAKHGIAKQLMKFFLLAAYFGASCFWYVKPGTFLKSI